MDLDLYSIFAGVFGTALTAVGGWFVFLRKNKTDEAAIALSAWKELVVPMQDEIERLKNQVERLEKKLEDAESKHYTERKNLLKRIRELEQHNSNA